MIDIIFPAKKIKKDSRIVIWGADITGVCFYEQINSLRYANIVTFIDSKIEKNHLNISINKPEWLRKNQSNYDYVLIGSVNISAQNEIKRILMEEYSVPLNKIVYEGYMPFIKHSGIADINLKHEIVDMIDKFGKNNAIAGKSIQYIVDTIRDDGILEDIKLLFHNSQSIKTKLTCAYILFSKNIGDSTMMEQVFVELDKCVLINPMWVHYFMFNILTTIIMRHLEYRHYNFYLDGKKLISKIAGLIYKEKRKKKFADEKKIAIACSVPLPGENWHITKLIAQIANGLNINGYKLAVFIESKVYSSNEFFIDTYFGAGYDMSNYEKSNRKAFDQDISIFYSEGASMSEHANDYIDKIIEYNPSNVIFFGADRTCATRVLYDLFPIVYAPTTTMGSRAYFHCLVCQNISSLLEINDKYPWIDNKQKLQECPALDITMTCNNVYDRDSKGWKKDEFIVVTVGNRLKYDLNNKYIDVMCHEIENNEALKWVIVGVSSIQYIDIKYKKLVKNKKIEYIKYEDDLMALYKIVNAYLNPDRVGGGLSIKWAMQSKLPVITLDIVSDGREWVGKENSIKGDYNALMDELRKLMYDKEYYIYKKQKMLEKTKEWSNGAYINNFIEILDKAIKIFNEQNNESE